MSKHCQTFPEQVREQDHFIRDAEHIGESGLPYFNFLKERSGDFSRADFARLQREALENYLIGLMRAVVRNFLLRVFGYAERGSFRCFIQLPTVWQAS